jgi:sensor domain DACNV-containing protein
VSPDGEKDNATGRDGLTQMGLASRLPGDVGIVSKLLELLRSLPNPATHSVSIPSADAISVLLNTAFWASLQQEEGRPVAVPLVLQSPSTAEDLVFEHAIPLNVQAVVKLAPAVHRGRRGLGIRADGSQAPAIWGLTPMTPTAICVDVKGPGLLVVKGMLRNVMIYHAGEATFLEDEDYDTLVRLTRLALPADTPAGDRFVNAYWTTRVVDAMRRTGRGGIVLLVPSGSSGWRDALSDAPTYQCSPPFRGLRDALDRLLPNPYAVNALLESEHLQHAADTVGQVTAVDGATVLDLDLKLLAFGAMIQSGPPSIGDVVCVEAGRAKAGGITRSLRELGGARHRAAAGFCCRIQESVAFVASQDGVLTELGWLGAEEKLVALLHAERYLL